MTTTPRSYETFVNSQEDADPTNEPAKKMLEGIKAER